MIREVDLASYQPPFMRVYGEPAAAMEAENPEFVFIWEATDSILYNHFISTADIYGISRYEQMLGIKPSGGDDLETRRMRIRNRWVNTIPYTLRALAEKIKGILGAQYNFSIYGDFKNKYALSLTVYTVNDSQNAELEYTLSFMVPLNVVTNIVYEGVLEGHTYFGGAIHSADITEIKQR